MHFIDALVNSFNLLKKKPKLFLPKFLIAAVYGVMMLLTMDILVSLTEFIFTENQSQAAVYAAEMLPVVSTLFIFSLFVLLLDTFINSMYPKMVDDFYKKKKISFTDAVKSAFSRSLIVIPSIFTALFIFMLVSMPFILWMAFSLVSNDIVGIILSGILLIIAELITTIMFYLIYPVSMLEKKGVFGTLGKSFSLSKSNFKDISKASIFQLLLSFVSFVLAAVADKPEFLFLFIVSRFLTALIATYIIVLNPVIYMEIQKVSSKGKVI
ncbi:MAG: hypothetical protein V1672_00290 [Candidatus Diapherotrites archaeon]